MRNHDNANKEWTDEELKKLYETHERLLDLVSLFCYVPRAKYLPLGPIRYGLSLPASLLIFVFNLSFLSSIYPILNKTTKELFVLVM